MKQKFRITELRRFIMVETIMRYIIAIMACAALVGGIFLTHRSDPRSSEFDLATAYFGAFLLLAFLFWITGIR